MEVLAPRELYFLKGSLHARPGFIPPRTRKIIVVLARTLANANANLQPYLFKYVISARNPPQWRNATLKRYSTTSPSLVLFMTCARAPMTIRTGFTCMRMLHGPQVITATATQIV